MGITCRLSGTTYPGKKNNKKKKARLQFTFHRRPFFRYCSYYGEDCTNERWFDAKEKEMLKKKNQFSLSPLSLPAFGTRAAPPATATATPSTPNTTGRATRSPPDTPGARELSTVKRDPRPNQHFLLTREAILAPSNFP